MHDTWLLTNALSLLCHATLQLFPEPGCFHLPQVAELVSTLSIQAERQTTATKAQTTPTPCSRVMDSCRTNGASTITTSG